MVAPEHREYSCGHFRWIASKWCPSYRITHRRCQPDVTHFEYRADDVVGECQPKTYPPWENMIRRNNKQWTSAFEEEHL
ncbi:hypothetical protein B0H63DRAFT_499225 [Podospora didyma]|uniref:Uncharacterized protein n=1 Tax=Podospora didyma TaxID=330526 RepID=A0AAE0U8J0_9PEZI|nr:hypothetical protein B0H63DRAFT_499225 [Podospora didyma]